MQYSGRGLLRALHADIGIIDLTRQVRRYIAHGVRISLSPIKRNPETGAASTTGLADVGHEARTQIKLLL